MADPPQFRNFENDLYRDHQRSSGRGVETIDSIEGEGIGLQQPIDVRNSYSGKLFVGGISWETSEEMFANYFSNYGEIKDSVIMMDRHTGRPRGFGFVTFADPAVADKVLEEDHVIDGRTVEVKKTVPREDMEIRGVSRTRKIFVGGLPSFLTEDELKEYFSSYGTIVENQIMLDHVTGRSRGFGFVTFASEDTVERLFSEGNTHELGGKLVEIKKAEPKRAGAEYNAGVAKPYGGRNGSQGGHGGKMGGEDAGYGGYSSCSGHDGYGVAYAGVPAGFYGAYCNPGGYMYGYGFGMPMYSTGYRTPSDYDGATGYGGGGDVYGGKGYESGSGHAGGKTHLGGNAVTGRYHPY